MHDFLVSIDNLQRDRASGRLEKIINDGARRRVLGGGFLWRNWSACERIVVDANGSRRMVKPECICLRGICSLPQRSDVVENPERASVRGNDQIFAVNREIANRCDRKIQLQRLPVVAVIEGNVNSELGSGKEQPLLLSIFANGARERVRGNAIANW